MNGAPQNKKNKKVKVNATLQSILTIAKKKIVHSFKKLQFFWTGDQQHQTNKHSHAHMSTHFCFPGSTETPFFLSFLNPPSLLNSILYRFLQNFSMARYAIFLPIDRAMDKYFI